MTNVVFKGHPNALSARPCFRVPHISSPPCLIHRPPLALRSPPAASPFGRLPTVKAVLPPPCCPPPVRHRSLNLLLSLMMAAIAPLTTPPPRNQRRPPFRHTPPQLSGDTMVASPSRCIVCPAAATRPAHGQGRRASVLESCAVTPRDYESR
jgi:hypothetical protein